MSGLVAVVPAAGRSRRMGRPKPLLPFGESDFLGTILGKLRESSPALRAIVVVRRRDDDALAQRLRSLAGDDLVPVIVEPDAGDMLHSVRTGAAAVPDARGVFVWPVDAPAVAASTLAAVVSAAVAHPEHICQPRHGEEPGHPVYVPAVVFRARVGDAALASGLRGLLEESGLPVCPVAVDDPWCLLNTNTPAEYHGLRDDPGDS